ncbi:MAG TPA: Vms1/Ankzf1 family peptidyl-tRNA hydrolase [Actinomycetota bacterium]|nr:Vms1/Ankzf1 family peptidyl-tRNA hydrolase [Actinomycetota bacterium]
MPAPDPGLVRKLADWETGGLPVTSLYLDVDGRRRPRRADFVGRAEDLVRRARDRAPADRDAARSVHRDLERVLRFVRDDFDRRGVRGLAVFACSDAGLWEEVALAAPLRDRLVVRPGPYLLPLEAVLERSEAFCVALVDRAKARLLRASLGQAEEVSDILDEVPGRHDQGGWAQARLQRHIEDHVLRHLKHVAEVLLRQRQRGAFDRLVLSGPHEVVAELERELHDYVRRAVVERATLPVGASTTDVAALATAVEERLDREREEEAVARVVSERGAGRAVAGLEPTLEALASGRVETIVVPSDLDSEGFRCPACGRLTVAGSRCPVCGSATEPSVDLLEEAVEVALRQGCRVETVAGDGLAEVGGIGALLRF